MSDTLARPGLGVLASSRRWALAGACCLLASLFAAWVRPHEPTLVYLVGCFLVLANGLLCGALAGAATALVFAAFQLGGGGADAPTPHFFPWLALYLACATLFGLATRTTREAQRRATERTRDFQEAAERIGSLNDELSVARRRLQLFLENADMLVWLKDDQFRYVIANQPACRSVGRDASEVLGATDEALVAPALAEAVRRRELAVLASGRPHRDEQLLENAGRCYRITRFPVPFEDGRVGIGGTAVDVTDEREALASAEQALIAMREHAALVDAVFQHVPEGITVAWGPEARIATVSRHGLELLKKDASTLQQVAASEHPRTWEVMHPDGRTLARPEQLPLTKACRGETTRNEEWLIRDAEGTLVPILCDAGPIRDPAGEVLGGIIAWRDISALKAQQEKRMVESAKLRALLHNTPLAVVVWDAQFRITEWSGAAERVFGFTAAEMVGRRLADCGLVPPDHAPRVGAAQEALRATADFVVSHNDNWTRDRRRLSCEWYNSVVRDPSGQMTAVLSLVLDVSERQRHERELVEADRRKDRFLAVLAHELRNPVAPLRTVAQVLDHDDSPDTVARVSGVIKRQVAQISRLLDDLMDVSRLTLGRLSIRLEPVDLRTVVADAVEQTAPLLRSASQDLEIPTPDEPVRVQGDRARLAQCVANLLSNAARYAGRPGRVRITLEAVDGQAVLAVADDGAGIAPERLATLFTASGDGIEDSMRQGGLGLGLPLVKGLVELQHGTVTAHSDGPGLGARFTLRLPLLLP